MKSKIPYLTTSAAALLITTANLQAQNQPGGFYIKVDAGGALQQDMRFNSSDVTFDPGVRTSLNFGYNFCKSFAAEIETGSIWNSLDKVNGTPLSDFNQEGDLYQVPILAKVIFKLPFENGLTPYIGGGVGGVGASLRLQDSFVDDTDTDFAFAYQGEAGLKYAINEHIEVGVGYKFIGTSGYSFFENDPFFQAKTSNSYNHSILASFVWNF
jgi:OOP family OmpA-OmpF porin